VLGSARQMGGPWVYDVSLLALPDAKEFKGKKRPGQQKYAKQSTDQFLAAVKTVAPSAVWYAPGQVLVFGEKKTHDAVAALLDELAEPGAKPAESKEVTALQKVTSARYAARKEARSKYLAALARARVVRKMAEHSWALYAAALKGEVSLEHLTELQAAWADPRSKELLDKASFTAARSTWLIGASAKMLPKNAELRALAKTSLAASYGPIRKTLIPLPKKSDAASFVKALYGAMAADLPGLYKVDAKTRKAIAKGRGELTTVKPGKDPLADLRLIARVLLEPIKDVDGAAKAVQKLAAEQRLRGDDMVVLGALAARRLGGDTWDKFRANQSDILGKQRLSGQVIVLVNRLAAAPEMVIAKK